MLDTGTRGGIRILHIVFPFWGDLNMSGVHNAHLYIKERCPAHLSLEERDIDNAYRESNKPRVIDSVTKAASIVKQHRHMQGSFWFSIAKGGLKSRDGVGKASDKGFRTVSLDEVLNYVRWDIYHTNLFTLWGVSMEQQKKGVPIWWFSERTAHVPVGSCC